MNISFYELAKYIISNSSNDPQSIILLTQSLIEKKDWQGARNQIKSLLTHQPLKEVCLLMSKIEEGDSGDPQKVHAWVSRSNLGKLSEIWICQISGVSQSEWTSISKAGYFNSLEWKYPNKLLDLSKSDYEMESLVYRDN